MTKSQTKIVNELKAAFGNATVEVVDQSEFNGKVKVFMSVAPLTCKGKYLQNQFEVGPRGGLKVILKQFDATY